MTDVSIIVTTETVSALDHARAEIDGCPVDAEYRTVIQYVLAEAGISPHGNAKLEVTN